MYRTARTQPIPVQAHANTQIISDSTNTASRLTRLAVERTTTTPSAITVLAAGARGERLLPDPRTLLVLLAAGPCGLLLLAAAQLGFRNRNRLFAAHRRHRALPEVLAALHRASRTSAPDAAAIAQAIRSFVASRLNVSGAVLTASDIDALLQTHGVSAATAAACGALLARLEQALYQPGSAPEATAAAIPVALALLPRLADELDHPPRQAEDEP